MKHSLLFLAACLTSVTLLMGQTSIKVGKTKLTVSGELTSTSELYINGQKINITDTYLLIEDKHLTYTIVTKAEDNTVVRVDIYEADLIHIQNKGPNNDAWEIRALSDEYSSPSNSYGLVLEANDKGVFNRTSYTRLAGNEEGTETELIINHTEMEQAIKSLELLKLKLSQL